MSRATAFTQWAETRGVEIDGVAVREFDDRGCGIVASRALKRDEIILAVPRSALILAADVTDKIPHSLRDEITVHGLLATELCLRLDTDASLAPWRAILPSAASFHASVPLTWPAALQALAPPEAAALLTQQQRKIRADWALASAALPELRWAEFQHAWLLVNTRCFYYEAGPAVPRRTARGTKKPRVLTQDDCMALAPFADIFNHVAPPSGCAVKYSSRGFTVTTERAFDEGEEMCISYGRHSNDFLLAEYGFILPDGTNTFDKVLLDPVVLPALSKAQREVLKEEGFLGAYSLDVAGPCFRTEVALMIKVAKHGEWLRFKGGECSEAEEKLLKKKLGIFLTELLSQYLEVIASNITKLQQADQVYTEQRDTLLRRWKQIQSLIQEWIINTSTNS